MKILDEFDHTLNCELIKLQIAAVLIDNVLNIIEIYSYRQCGRQWTSKYVKQKFYIAQYVHQ